MQCIHTTNYKLYQKYIKRPFKIVVISDLHFSYKIKNSKLNSILKEIKKQKPDYILFVGDIIDSTDMVEDKKEEVRILSFIEELGKIAKTIISLGNHDFYKKNKGKSFWKFIFKKDFFDKINDLDNVWLLDNDIYEDNNIFIFGYTKNSACYFNEKELTNDIEKLKKKIGKTPFYKLKIFMSHSPVGIEKEIKNKNLSSFDYYISGHMHNGVVPPVLYEIWNTNRGIVSPNKKVLPKYTRNTLRKKNDKLLVNGALTTFHESSKMFYYFNFLYPSYMSILTFTNDKKQDKIKIEKNAKYKFVSSKERKD